MYISCNVYTKCLKQMWCNSSLVWVCIKFSLVVKCYNNVMVLLLILSHVIYKVSSICVCDILNIASFNKLPWLYLCCIYDDQLCWYKYISEAIRLTSYAVNCRVINKSVSCNSFMTSTFCIIWYITKFTSSSSC